jgi:hypothetical protein
MIFGNEFEALWEEEASDIFQVQHFVTKRGV